MNDQDASEEIYAVYDAEKGIISSSILEGSKLKLKEMGPTIWDQIICYQPTTEKINRSRCLELIGERRRQFKGSNWNFKFTFQKKLKCHPDGNPLKDASIRRVSETTPLSTEETAPTVAAVCRRGSWNKP